MVESEYAHPCGDCGQFHPGFACVLQHLTLEEQALFHKAIRRSVWIIEKGRPAKPDGERGGGAG